MSRVSFAVAVVFALLLCGMARSAPVDVTAPGDIVQGVPDDGDWPGAEAPPSAIDDNASTKYLHFKGFTQPTGFRVTPSSTQSIVTGLTFTTANDAPERDPIAFQLYGSSDRIDGPYTLIASGDIADFRQATAWPRLTRNQTPISFANESAYRHYQVLFTAVRDPGSANSMQIAEVELLGTCPAPSDPSPADGAILRDTWVALGWTPGDYAVSHSIYVGEIRDDVAAGTGDTLRANQTDTSFALGFPGFPYPDGLVSGTTYYWRIEDVEADGTTTHSGPVWSFAVAPRSAYSPDPADGTEFVDPNVVLSWEPGFGAILHYLYFGDDYDEVKNATVGLPQGATTYTPGTLELGKTFYWRVDAFHGFATVKGDVWCFTTPGAVGNARPANGAVDVRQDQILRWSPADYAASHEVYFGTDKDAVLNASTGSPEYKGSKNLGSESHDPGKLQWDATYYWRVDEVDASGNASKGPLWSFTTADYLVVDDFESYNDIDPPDPANNRIFESWIDGFGTTTNGALVGNDMPPYAEQTIVHGGRQSMPYLYENNLKTSEATMALTYPRDWTEGGVETLTIWFHGNLANAAAPMYVALNGGAAVYHDDPGVTQMHAWTQWNIPLQAFADQGVNLANVNTISIGFGTKNSPTAGGSGTMYFDDIGVH